MTSQKIVTAITKKQPVVNLVDLYPIVDKFYSLVNNKNYLQGKTTTIKDEVTSKFKSVFLENDDFVKILSEIKYFVDEANDRFNNQSFYFLIKWLQSNKYIDPLPAKSEESISTLHKLSTLYKLRKITEFYNIINQVNEFLEKKDIKLPSEPSKSQANWTPPRNGIKVNKILTNTENNPNPTELEPLKFAKQISYFLALFNKNFYRQITHKDYKSPDHQDTKKYYILKDTENDEVNSDKSSETENTKISYCPLLQILKSPNDEKIKNDTVGFIVKSINQAIKSCVNEVEEPDNNIKWFKYFLIAIKLQGIGNKEMECQNLLIDINKNENLSEADLLNFNDAKKLSSLFQMNTMQNNIFTGRVEDYTRPKKVVGMRTKRIPSSLLMSVAKSQLNDEDFQKLESFREKLNQNSFNLTPDSSLSKSKTSKLKTPSAITP